MKKEKEQLTPNTKKKSKKILQATICQQIGQSGRNG